MKILKNKKVEDQQNNTSNLALQQHDNNKNEELEKELESLRIGAKSAVQQVKQLESEKAELQKQVDEHKDEWNKKPLLGRWRSSSKLVDNKHLENRYSLLFKEKLEMEEDLTAMIKDRDEKISMMRKEHQQLQRKQDLSNTESISKSSKKKLEKVAKATELLREEVDHSMLKISKMTNVVDTSVETLLEILDGLGQREGCDEEDAMALSLGETLSLLQQHVKVSLHLLEQKVGNRLNSIINDAADEATERNPFQSNDLFTDIRIEVMDLIRKADLELNEKIKYMQLQIEELKEC